MGQRPHVMSPDLIRKRGTAEPCGDFRVVESTLTLVRSNAHLAMSAVFRVFCGPTGVEVIGPRLPGYLHAGHAILVDRTTNDELSRMPQYWARRGLPRRELNCLRIMDAFCNSEPWISSISLNAKFGRPTCLGSSRLRIHLAWKAQRWAQALHRCHAISIPSLLIIRRSPSSSLEIVSVYSIFN